jgi:hypothetical protein
MEFTNDYNLPPPNVTTEQRTLIDAIKTTLGAYRDAVRDLLALKYPDLIDLAPPHMRVPSDCTVFICDDGLILRWDRSAGHKPLVRVGVPSLRGSITDLVTGFSEGFVYCPLDRTTFQPPPDGPKIQMLSTAPSGEGTAIAEVPIAIVADWGTLQAQSASATRPVPLVSLTCEVDIHLHCEEYLASVEEPVRGTGRAFVAAVRWRLGVGWEAFEVYASIDPTLWQPTLAPLWAELDLLSAVAKRNLLKQQLHAIDPSAASRARFAVLLTELRGLLGAAESPVQLFLERNPMLLSQTHTYAWPKLALGNRVTDFVFREAGNDYLLVELEAPTRRLFRKDGQPHQDLVHAMSQVADWVRYIEDNHDAVERELGLPGISTSPRCLIVIGRSSDLTIRDKRMLTTMNNQSPKLRILTYDDLLDVAKANIENMLGTLRDTRGSADIFYYPRR